MPTDAERLAACDAEVASHRAKFPDVAHIEPETLRQMQSDGPVLLVCTDARTRWTATVAAALLRENGVSQVLLLALHLQP